MASSSQRQRLAALEAQARVLLEQVQDRLNACTLQRLTDDELAGVIAYVRRQKDDPNAQPEGAEIPGMERYTTLVETDPEEVELGRKYGPLAWALEWGKAWQARY